MKSAFFALALLGLSTSAAAETLNMPADTSEAMQVPTRGMSMAAVERRFGSPQAKLAPVGEPPISRWIYRDYKVFFEHQHVIHTVKKDPR